MLNPGTASGGPSELCCASVLSDSAVGLLVYVPVLCYEHSWIHKWASTAVGSVHHRCHYRHCHQCHHDAIIAIYLITAITSISVPFHPISWTQVATALYLCQWKRDGSSCCMSHSLRNSLQSTYHCCKRSVPFPVDYGWDTHSLTTFMHMNTSYSVETNWPLSNFIFVSLPLYNYNPASQSLL